MFNTRAVSTRYFGNNWYVSLLASNLRNVETNELGQYIDARGLELYAQWQSVENWWLIGGGNRLEPCGDDPDGGQYSLRHLIFGFRYSFDSFKRMLYLEYLFDDSLTTDGAKGKDELTVGVRWDFGD